jgi:UDP-GlcNAc3NAcA epimerase
MSPRSHELKVCSIVGARPQLVKAAIVSRAVRLFNQQRSSGRIQEILIHTGQHYDFEMSQVFFNQLKIPKPRYQLGVGSGPHGFMTGTMLMGIEKALVKENPDWVLVYGDTNSTLAGAFAAAKIPLPIAHVEAGLRSFNRSMPEEINRILADRLSGILFSPTREAVHNLRKEGIVQGVFNVGDVMYDAFLAFRDLAEKKSKILIELGLTPGRYGLATVHRQENTDDFRRLDNIFRAFHKLASQDCPILIPVHPRTEKALKRRKTSFAQNPFVRRIPPVDYLDMIALECGARAILTDSGGIQKEAFFAQVPCVTLRDETEWPETVESGWNELSGARTETIVKCFSAALRSGRRKKSNPKPHYGDGKAGQKIVDILVNSSPFDLAAWKPARYKHIPLPYRVGRRRPGGAPRA